MNAADVKFQSLIGAKRFLTNEALIVLIHMGILDVFVQMIFVVFSATKLTCHVGLFIMLSFDVKLQFGFAAVIVAAVITLE